MSKGQKFVFVGLKGNINVCGFNYLTEQSIASKTTIISNRRAICIIKVDGSSAWGAFVSNLYAIKVLYAIN